MTELNKKLVAVIKGEQRQLVRLDEVQKGVKVPYTDLGAVIKGVVCEIVDNVLYQWAKFSVIETVTGYTLCADGGDLDTLKEDIDADDYYAEENCDIALEESGGMTGPVYQNCAFYSTISIDTNGNIVGGSSGTYTSDYCRIRVDGKDTWYFIGDYDSDYTLYLFELTVEADITYSQGSFIENVTTSDSNAYSEGRNEDGFWYVYLGEVKNNA